MNSKTRKKPRTNQNKRRVAGDARLESKAERPVDSEPTRAPYNDAAWYARNPQLLKDAASLSFNIPVGARMHLQDYYPLGAEAFWSVKEDYDRIPTIMTITFAPSIGVSKDNSSAINIAARNIYSFVRHQNSGHANYDSPDLMMYLLAMDSVYMLWNWGKRLYGVINLYSQYNAALPDALIRSMGFDPVSIRSNIANLRYFLNQAAAKLNSFAVPATMPLMIRHSWMVSNVWRDSYSEKSQLYVYVPQFFHKWNEVMEGPGKLSATNLIGNLGDITYETYVSTLTGAITAISTSEDCGIMSGDILKAYSTSGLLTLSAVAEDYTVIPVYNEEVLTQIQNMNVINPTGGTTWDITQSTSLESSTSGALMFTPSASVGSKFNYPKFINLPWNKTEPADVMVASRLMIAAGPATTTDLELIAVGSEVVVGLYVWTDANTHVLIDYQIRMSKTPDETAVRKVLYQTTLLSSFDWHPGIPMGILTNAEEKQPPVEYLGTLCDFNNYTPVADTTIAKMHDTALLSLFGVPANGLV